MFGALCIANLVRWRDDSCTQYLIAAWQAPKVAIRPRTIGCSRCCVGAGVRINGCNAEAIVRRRVGHSQSLTYTHTLQIDFLM